jgi:hypothetical protein
MHVLLHRMHFFILVSYEQIMWDEGRNKLRLRLTGRVRFISSKVMLVPWSCLHLWYDSMSYLMASEVVLDPGQTRGNGSS